MNPKQISIEEFDYHLPDERIAVFPNSCRDSSKLLVYRHGSIGEDIFNNVVSHLPGSSIIVFNDTRVVEARILLRKPTGAAIEIFCLEPDRRYPDITTAFAQKKTVFWKCLVGNAAAWNPGLIIEKKIGGDLTLFAEMMEREKDHFIIRLSWMPEDFSFAEILHLAGITPLPPYIKRKPEAADAERYQTIYAQYSGSVAAPTAGLHFTRTVLESLSQKNIQQKFVTLHVGAGTFKPVKTGTLGEHEMHQEFFEVNRSLIETICRNPGMPIIAVGTTSLRTLESLYWLGIKIHSDNNILPGQLQVTQWEPYENSANLPVNIALESILEWMQKNNTDVLTARTSLIIVPPYVFRIVSVLITNFHQPRSTLLLLVAAFIGKTWRSVYTYALEHDFRFLSYGDSCLLFRQ